MTLKSIILVLLTLPVSLQVCFAQETPAVGCKIIDKSSNSISIRYEKVESLKSKNKEDQIIYLRLYNNTNCTVYIPLQGRTKDIDDGEILQIEFLTQEKEQERAAKEFENSIDAKFFARLRGGRYCLFRVPLEVFRNKYFVIVPFYYEWDFPDDSNSVTHQSRFYYGDIPSNIISFTK